MTTSEPCLTASTHSLVRRRISLLAGAAVMASTLASLPQLLAGPTDQVRSAPIAVLIEGPTEADVWGEPIDSAPIAVLIEGPTEADIWGEPSLMWTNGEG